MFMLNQTQMKPLMKHFNYKKRSGKDKDLPPVNVNILSSYMTEQVALRLPVF